jgi:hypothetical protein
MLSAGTSGFVALRSVQFPKTVGTFDSARGIDAEPRGSGDYCHRGADAERCCPVAMAGKECNDRNSNHAAENAPGIEAPVADMVSLRATASPKRRQDQGRCARQLPGAK